MLKLRVARITKRRFIPRLKDYSPHGVHVPGYENRSIDGNTVLKSIEEHHGLLSERAQFIYSFSHLTFQEYFAAKEVVHDATGVTLFGLLEPNTVASDRWREVILMTASMLPNATMFFERFETAIAELIKATPNIDEMFVWADRKAKQYFPDQTVVGRMHYLSLGLIFDGGRSSDRERARLVQEALTRAEKFAPLFGSQLTILSNTLTTFPLSLNKARADNVALQLDRTYDIPHQLETIDTFDCQDDDSDLAVDVSLTRLQLLTDLVTYAVDENPRRALATKFASLCRNIRAKYGIPTNEKIDQFLDEITAPAAGIVKHSRWVRFADALRAELEQHRDVGYDWRLSRENVDTLSRIFQATMLLEECLQVAVVSDSNRFVRNFFAPPTDD